MRNYIDAIAKLRTHGYSYADIANWLTEKLAENLSPKKIRRGQVYRVYQQWLQLHDPSIDSFSVPHISDEDAEANAEISDKKEPKPEKEKKP